MTYEASSMDDGIDNLADLLTAYYDNSESSSPRHSVTLVKGGGRRTDMIALRLLISFPDGDQAHRFMGLHGIYISDGEYEWKISCYSPEIDDAAGLYRPIEDDASVISAITLTSICDDETPLPNDLTGLTVSELSYAVYFDEPERGGGPCNPMSIESIELLFSEDAAGARKYLHDDGAAIVEQACQCPIDMDDVRKCVMAV